MMMMMKMRFVHHADLSADSVSVSDVGTRHLTQTQQHNESPTAPENSDWLNHEKVEVTATSVWDNMSDQKQGGGRGFVHECLCLTQHESDPLLFHSSSPVSLIRLINAARLSQHIHGKHVYYQQLWEKLWSHKQDLRQKLETVLISEEPTFHV